VGTVTTVVSDFGAVTVDHRNRSRRGGSDSLPGDVANGKRGLP